MAFLSVIIPAYNCRNFIERLLDSIVVQNYAKEDVEVVICDDNSTDNFMEVVNVPKYIDVLDIKYYKTEPREVHCPGNTRMDGWHHATGEWITFIDNDDAFEEGAFDLFKSEVAKGQTRMVFCKFREYSAEKNEYGKVFDGTTWLHGKFYNRKWLVDTGIDFKENLYSHEDLFFNSLCVAVLKGIGSNYSMPTEEKYAYKWIYRPDSLSRSYFNEKHYYIEVYLKDYLYAATEPWFLCTKYFPHMKDFYRNQILAVMLYGYFYDMGALWRLGDKDVLDNKKYMKDILERCMSVYGLTRTEVVAAAMASPEEYDRIKAECYNGCGHFVELVSYRDYIYRL